MESLKVSLDYRLLPSVRNDGSRGLKSSPKLWIASALPRNDGVEEAMKEEEALRAPRNDAVSNL